MESYSSSISHSYHPWHYPLLSYITNFSLFTRLLWSARKYSMLYPNLKSISPHLPPSTTLIIWFSLGQNTPAVVYIRLLSWTSHFMNIMKWFLPNPVVGTYSSCYSTSKSILEYKAVGHSLLLDTFLQLTSNIPYLLLFLLSYWLQLLNFSVLHFTYSKIWRVSEFTPWPS